MKFPKKTIVVSVIIILSALIAAAVFVSGRTPDFDSDGVLRLCIDPGHGGEDAGALSSDGARLEKDDCLALGLAVSRHMAEDWPQVEVMLTRTDDTYITLEDRCYKANDFNSDLFVSLHRNSSDGNAKGMEIWISSEGKKIEKSLASSILENLENAGISNNRGVKQGTASNSQGNYFVIANTDMPACLVEMGFMTSDADNELFDKNLEAYAKAIADAAGSMLTED